MPFVIGGALLVGAVASSEASKSAANKQAGAANNANALQGVQLQDTKNNLQSYLTSGGAANTQLAHLLGIPGYESGGRIINGAKYTDINQVKDIWRNDYRQKLIAQGKDPNVVGFDENAINAGVDREWANATPFEADHGDDFGSLLKPFGMEDFQASPAYNFNLEQGRAAIDKAAAARGRYYAPATLQDIAKYSQGLASNEFQNAFSNYNTSMGNIYNRLQNVSGSGQNAAVQQGGFGSGAAGNVGNNLIGAGNAQAAGTVGAANAFTGAANQGYNAYVLNQILGRNQQPTYGSVGGGGDIGSFDFNTVVA